MDQQNVQEDSTNITYNLVKFKANYTVNNYHTLFNTRLDVNIVNFQVLMPNTNNNILLRLMCQISYGNLSVVFGSVSIWDDVITKFCFSILNENNEPMRTTVEYSEIFTINNRESPVIKLLDHYDVNDYLFNDKIRICIEGTIYEKIISPTLNDLQERLAKDFGQLLNSQEFYDVTLSVGDTKLKAHKVILAARSPVFKAMFSHETTENTQNVVVITDIQPDVLKDLLHFIYTGEALTINTKADELLATADKYEVLDLKSKCEDALRKKITTEDVVQNIIFTRGKGNKRRHNELK